MLHSAWYHGSLQEEIKHKDAYESQAEHQYIKHTNSSQQQEHAETR